MLIDRHFQCRDSYSYIFMTKTAFVTGATGFLGLNLVQQLVEDGWHVTALHRASSNLTYLRRFPVMLAVGTVEDPASLAAALPDSVDAVFHVAGDVSFWRGHNARQRRVNIDGTRHILDAARQAGAKKFVHTSSIAAYGLPHGPFDESAPLAVRSSWIGYIDSKARGEEEVHQEIKAGMDAVILNPANIVGPYDTAHWGQLFALIAEDKLPGIPPGRAPFCHVRAVARAHITAVTEGRTGENYILGGPLATYAEAFAVVGDLLGHPVNAKPVPAFALKLAACFSELKALPTRTEPDLTREMAALLSADIRATSGKAARELGYESPSLEVMFRDCHNWLVAEGIRPPSPHHC